MWSTMADGCVYASSEAVSVEQREFPSEQDIPDPATYVSSLNTDELKQNWSSVDSNEVEIKAYWSIDYEPPLNPKRMAKSRLRGAALLRRKM